MSQIVVRPGPELAAADLHELLRLRCEVFVVEQRCAYQDVDGIDLLPTTTHLWVGDESRQVVSSLRVLAHEGERLRIGRVCTAADRRGQGHGARLMQAALDRHPGSAWILHAQSAVQGFYAGFGFEVSGPEFGEDGIAHVPMVRNV